MSDGTSSAAFSENTNNYSPEQVSQLGESYYFSTLREQVEAENIGKYLVLDVYTKKYVIGPNKLEASQLAEKELGNNLFYMIQIGSQKPASNFKARKYAWQI